MKLFVIWLALLDLAGFFLIRGATPGNAPALPITGVRIVNVASEPQLQNAINNLRDGDTLLLADGTYHLTRSLYINNRHNVTVRGAAGSTNVVLVGKGMNNSNHGGVPVGIWSNSTNTLIAHLTIRETWDNEIIFNSGAQAPRVYCVRLIDSGSQFIKSNPTDVNAGLGVNNGVVEHCVFEYTGTPPKDHGSGIGYFNGISAHAARNWIVRGNLFKNLHNPDGSAYPWNPAVLFWRNSSNTVTEQNTFINVDRAIAYGLDNATPYRDHAGGAIRNNFVYLSPGFLSAARKASSDGSIIAWNSPDTQIDHNTVMLNGNIFYAVQFRFPTTRNGTARNNLTDAPIHLRDNATATRAGNETSATSALFIDAASADLHLRPSAANAIDKAVAIEEVHWDFDGDRRPRGQAPDIGADEFTSTEKPVLLNLRLQGNDCVLSFISLLGTEYDLLRAPSLSGNGWSFVAENIPGNGTIIETIDADAALASSRFYRLRLSP
ncbi:MAG: hypothetical protein AB1813_09765 [Verrucomicrobiota bacterium]